MIYIVVTGDLDVDFNIHSVYKNKYLAVEMATKLVRESYHSDKYVFSEDTNRMKWIYNNSYISVVWYNFD